MSLWTCTVDAVILPSGELQEAPFPSLTDIQQNATSKKFSDFDSLPNAFLSICGVFLHLPAPLSLIDSSDPTVLFAIVLLLFPCVSYFLVLMTSSLFGLSSPSTATIGVLSLLISCFCTFVGLVHDHKD